MQLPTTTQKNVTFDRLWDCLLIIGLVLAPMNRLRLWKIGPGEALCFLWCLRYLQQIFEATLQNLFLRFWVVFLPLITLGACFCQLFYPAEADFSGILPYLYFALLSMGVYFGLQQRSAREIKGLLYIIGIVSILWYLFLYLYSVSVSSTLFGVDLWYAGIRYSGGANNPHHLATLMSAVIFVNVVHVFDPEVLLWKKLLPLFCIAAGFWIAMKTKSSTLIVALAVTSFFFLYYVLMKHAANQQQRWIISSGLLIVLALVVLLFREKLTNAVYDWIASDANGLSRLELFSSITETLRKNWLFGLGPGAHADGGTMEYHNAYLEVLAMGGVVGFAVFLLFSIRLFLQAMVEPSMIFCILPIYAYGLAGFSMRRLSFWVMIPILSAYSVKLRETLKDPAPDVLKPPAKIEPKAR